MPENPHPPQTSASEQETSSMLPPTRDIQRIGPYTVLEKRGEGGMGVV